MLGTVEVASDGERLPVGGPKQRGVLAHLVANAGHTVPIDRIVDDVYGEDADVGARRSVQTFVSTFRRELGDVIRWGGNGYLLDVDPLTIDANRFEQLVADARRLIPVDPVRAGRELRTALAMWRGHPYADVDGRGSLEPEITRLRELRLTALEWRIDADLAAGLHDQLVGELEALADEFPLRERLRAQQMLALYRAGRQTEALRAYRHAEQYLAEELGLEPSKELQDLELKILQQDEELLAGSGRTVTQRLAFLVTDIEGSTERWDHYPAAMADALAAHDRLLGTAVEESGGTVFKHTGDGLLAAFPSTTAAVRAIEAALRSLRDHEWGTVGELRVRAGIDVGEVESRVGDFYGPPVNRAARLAAAAHGGQVLVSVAAQRALLEDPPPGMQLRPLGEFQLRGFAAGERIGQVVFVGLPADFPELRIDAESTIADRAPLLSLPGYELRDVIGEGATGFVYRAFQPSVGREVAIKVIHPDFAGQPSFVRRFEAEARTIGRLAHPRIVPLHDFWRDSDGAYLVMQLLPGGTLTPLIGSLDLSSAVRIICHVGEALTHAHQLGVTHGDIKPGNILLDRDGNAYLSDFGISARLLEPAEVGAWSSSAPAYRAPEEAGEGPSVKSDQFALGMLAYETLTGRAPEAGGSRPAPSALNPQIPADLDSVIARATAFDPNDRFASIEQFLIAFDAAVTEAVHDMPPRLTALRNPYKGLQAFEEADAPDFYGRSELVGSLLAAVERLRFVTVVGPSGCGKSSAVRAGLVPRLRGGEIEGSDNWFVVAFTPGPQPNEALVEALESVATTPVDLTRLVNEGNLAAAAERLLGDLDGDLLLVIDQFEELFTLVEDPERRAEFLQLLTAAVTDPGSRVRVVATLRADFYDRPLEHDGIDRLVRDGLVTVLRPSRDELVEMITKPSLAVGLRWEPGLPLGIAAEVHNQVGGLPLLQFALTELVERRHTDLLGAADYERIGSTTGALATRAESAYQALPPGQQDTARAVLLRLVTVNEDAEDTRRRVRRSELESLDVDSTGLDTLLAELVARRLLTTDRDPLTHGPTIEVAHEALLHQWPRLREWIDEQRESLMLGRRLRAAMADWEDAGLDDDYLLTGHRLAPFAVWAPTTALTTDERAFFEASVTQDEAAAQARARRRRILTTILAVASVVALILATVAAVQWQRADRQSGIAEEQAELANEQKARAQAETARADNKAAEAEDARGLEAEQRVRAEAEERKARARELTSSALVALDTDPELSMLLTLEAMDSTRPDGVVLPEVETMLRRALAEHKLVAAFPGSRRLSVDAAGTRLAVLSADRSSAAVVDLETFETLIEIPGDPGDGLFTVTISPDGQLVAVGTSMGRVSAFEANSGTMVFDSPFAGGADFFEMWSSATEGEFTLYAYDIVFPFDARAAEVEAALEQAPSIADVSVTGEGTIESPWQVQLIEIAEAPFWFSEGINLDALGHVAPVDQLEFSADGTRLVSHSYDGTEWLWDLTKREGSRVSRLGVGTWFGDGIDLSSDASKLAVAPSEQGAIVVDLNGGGARSYCCQDDYVFDVRFFPQEDRLLTIGFNSFLKIWNLDTGIVEDTIYFPEGGGLITGDVSPDGRLIAAGGQGGLLRVWNVAEGGAREVMTGAHTGPVRDLTFTGDRLISVSNDTVKIWDITPAGGQELMAFPSVAGYSDVEYSPTGDFLFTVSANSEVVVRHAESGDPIRTLEGVTGVPEDSPVYPGGVWVVEASPDGRWVAVTGGNAGDKTEGALTIWETSTWERTLLVDRMAEDVRFSADSRWVVASFRNGVYRWEVGSFDESRVTPGSWAQVAPHPKGPAVATTGYGVSEVTFFDVSGGGPIGDPIQHGQIWTIRYSPDGTLLFVGGDGGMLYDADTHEVVRELEGHPVEIQGSDFSPDGLLLATVDREGDIRVFDVVSGSLLLKTNPHDGGAGSISFSADGELLASTGGQGSVKISILDSEPLISTVRARLTRDFTLAECATYGIDPCPAPAEG